MFGGAAYRNAPEIARIITPLAPKTLLDYGCGKGTLKPALAPLMPGLEIFEYDPAIPGKGGKPKPADVVTCLDVMEHIEPEFVDAVIANIRALTKRLLVASVTTRPAKKILADGRNAHLIVQPKEWWLGQFGKHFKVAETSDQEGAFIGLFQP